MKEALHLYGQAWPHETAFIVGDTETLKKLRDAIDAALKHEVGGASFYTQDGEGYDVMVVDASKMNTEELHLPYSDMEGIGLKLDNSALLTPVDLIGKERFVKLRQALLSGKTNAE